MVVSSDGFTVPKTTNERGFVLGRGSFVTGPGTEISIPAVYISVTTAPILNVLAPGAITQVFFDDTGAFMARQVKASGEPFPDNCLPLFEATVNEGGLITDLQDRRRSL